jgi:hypothetical protein
MCHDANKGPDGPFRRAADARHCAAFRLTGLHLRRSSRVTRWGRLLTVPAEAPVSPQGQPPEEPRSAKSVADQVWNLVGHDMAVALGPNPSQELFRFAAYEPSCFDWLAGGEDAILGRVQTLLRLRVP